MQPEHSWWKSPVLETVRTVLCTRYSPAGIIPSQGPCGYKGSQSWLSLLADLGLSLVGDQPQKSWLCGFRDAEGNEAVFFIYSQACAAVQLNLCPFLSLKQPDWSQQNSVGQLLTDFPKIQHRHAERGHPCSESLRGFVIYVSPLT